MVLLVLLFSLSPVFAGTTDDRSIIHSMPSGDYALYGLISLFLVLLGGLMSGLTVGLLGIDELSLELKIASGTAEEKRNALKVLKIISNHHLLLVTLLLANALAMEALPLCLDAIFNTELSLAISVTFVLAFGEVIPQSLCTGPNQIKIACRCVPIVSVFIVILFPISYPISKLLDKIFGLKEAKRKLGDNELKTFIGIQKTEMFERGGLDTFQVQMMFQTMDLSKVNASEIVIPLSGIPMANVDSPLNYALISMLCQCNINFVTVYKDNIQQICGYFRIQKVFSALNELNLSVKNIELEDINFVKSEQSLLDCLKELESYNAEIGYVQDMDGNTAGVIRKQDILNRILASTSVHEREGISEISSALIQVLENKERRGSGKKAEMIQRKKEFIA